jgi:hypothetical protein
VNAGGIRWQVASELRERLLSPTGLRLDEWLAKGQARVVKSGPHRTVYRVSLPGLDFHVKHYRLMDARALLRQLIRPSKARMEYDRARAVADRHVATITPLGLGEEIRAGTPGHSFLLTRSLDDVKPLNRLVERELPNWPAHQSARLRLSLASGLGAFIGRMHEAGIRHRDLHAGNLLVSSCTLSMAPIPVSS